MTGVVVLNYKNYECTIKCVENLKNQDVDDLEICIVDNGSRNASPKVLTQEFTDCRGVSIILNKDNFGFARGNNVGIDYLRGKGCTDILIINSDVMLKEKTAISQLLKRKRKNLGVISPVAYDKESGKIECIYVKKKEMFRKRMTVELLRTVIKGSRYNANTVEKSNEEYFKEASPEKNYFFTGSVFLLTSEFFKKYSGLFAKTFLYYEEWATTVLLYKAGLDSETIDVGRVYHQGAASSGEITAVNKDKYERNSAAKILRLLLSPA